MMEIGGIEQAWLLYTRYLRKNRGSICALGTNNQWIKMINKIVSFSGLLEFWARGSYYLLANRLPQLTTRHARRLRTQTVAHVVPHRQGQKNIGHQTEHSLLTHHNLATCSTTCQVPSKWPYKGYIYLRRLVLMPKPQKAM